MARIVSDQYMRKLLQELNAYRKTGLTPEEVRELVDQMASNAQLDLSPLPMIQWENPQINEFLM